MKVCPSERQLRVHASAQLRCLLSFVLLLLVTVRTPASGAGSSLRPLLDPAPGLPDAPFVLRLAPSNPAPSNTVLTKVVLRDFGIDFTGVHVGSIVSSIGFPRILQVGGQLGDGPSQLSLVLDAPLGGPAEALFEFNATPFVAPGRWEAPGAHALVRCAAASRPGTFVELERLETPVDVEVRDVRLAAPALEVQLLSPSTPALPSSPAALNLVEYRLRLNLAGAAAGDVLSIVPMAVLLWRIQVPHGRECPPLVPADVPMGVHIPWNFGSCRFVMMPTPLLGEAPKRTNAVEVTITDVTALERLQMVIIKVPALESGSAHAWLLALRRPSDGDAYDVARLGASSSPEDGLAVEPRPLGAVLSSSSRAIGATGVRIDLALKPNIDLISGGGCTLIVAPTSGAAQINECHVVTASTGEVSKGKVEASLAGAAECRISTADRYMSTDGSVRMRLLVDHPAAVNASELVGFAASVALASGWASSPGPLFGEYGLVQAAPLENAGLYLTGFPRGRPLPLLITFKTSEADLLGYSMTASQAETSLLFPAWRAPAACSQGCARWGSLMDDGNTFLQTDADALWGESVLPPAGVGRACARPPGQPRSGPWCFCRGASDASWGLCRPDVIRLRLQLLDASKFRLLRATDGARLLSVSEANAQDCASYIRDFSADTLQSVQDRGLAPPPKRCWGDTMQEDGGSVFIEWSPGLGLQSGVAYALEVIGSFPGIVTKSDALISLATIASSTEGLFQVREEAELPPNDVPLSESGSKAHILQQPTITAFTADLLDVDASTDPVKGRFVFSILAGADGVQWLRAGHMVDLFLFPLSVWDIAVEGSSCPPLVLDVSNADSESAEPTCRSYSVGEAGIADRQNAIRLVLGQNTVINGQEAATITVTLSLPPGGLLAVHFGISARHQDQAGDAAWYAEARTALTWSPQVWRAGLFSAPEAFEGASFTARLFVVPAATARGLAGARLRVVPPAGFAVVGAASVETDLPGRMEVDVASSAPVALGSGAFDIAISPGTTLFAGAEYSVGLSAIASQPSRGARLPWAVQLLVLTGGAAEEALKGPTQSLEAGGGISAGVLVPGMLRASVLPLVLHASAHSTLHVYFQPAQTQGIFFRYLVFTAPRGYDFATIRSPLPRSAAEQELQLQVEPMAACQVISKLNLPPHIQCQPRRLDELSESDDVAEVILPPLSRLELRPYGFAVDAIMPSFSSAWVEEVSNRAHFALETRTEDYVLTDRLEQLPRADWPDPSASPPPGSTQQPLLLPDPLPVYPHGCHAARVRIDGLLPEQLAGVRLTLEPGIQVSAPSFLYIHAPLGYEWEFDEADWELLVSRGGGPSVPLNLTAFSPAVLPDGTLFPGRRHILCVNVSRPILADEVFTLTARARTPRENPDGPQSSGLLPSPPLWHVELSSSPLALGKEGGELVSDLASRVFACNAIFDPPNRVRRVYAAEASPSNVVVGELNDVTVALTTVTEVPQGGTLIVEAVEDAFSFPTNCEIVEAAVSSASVVGLPLPVSAGAACSSGADAPHRATIGFARGVLTPNSYIFTVKEMRNRMIVSETALWRVYTTLDGDGLDKADLPVSFTAFSVLEAMSDAFIDTEILDIETAQFTKRRSAQNQVVICFLQSIATPAGQTLTVYMPEGFRIAWRDSDDCLSPDPVLGVPPVVIDTPFGEASADPALFTTLPEGMRIPCASSTDGGIAYLTLSEGLVEISRYYALRLAVQNAERSPPANFWRLQLGQQASRLIPGFTMQAFLQLELSATVLSAAQAGGSAPPNLVQVLFQPSVPVPFGGALRIRLPVGFTLVSAVPRSSRGELLAAGARCAGESLVLGTGYTFEQCEATCRERPSCEFFSVGFGENEGACIQEGSIEDGSPPPCQETYDHDSFSVYQMVATGNCFRFELLEAGERRTDVDCDAAAASADSPAALVLRLGVSSRPLAVGVVYHVTVAVRNPEAAPEQNTWSVQSFSQSSLALASILDDGIVDGFKLSPALASFGYAAEPKELRSSVDVVVNATFTWSPSVNVEAGSDILQVALPAWLGLPPDVCGTLSALPAGAALHAPGSCQVTADPYGIRFLLSGPEGSLSAGAQLDFSFAVQNPNASVVTGIPRGELSMASLTHLRPIVSAVTGKTLEVALASSAAAAHTVLLTLAALEVRQVAPQFVVVGERPMSLEIDLKLRSAGADQIWVGSPSENPLDFAGARCTVTLADSSGADNSSADEESLYGQFECVAVSPVEFDLDAARTTHFSRLRVDAARELDVGPVYRLTVEGIGGSPRTGFVRMEVSTSVADRSVDYREFGQVVLLDSNADEIVGLQFTGDLELSPVGAGSFAALSASAFYGIQDFIAADHVHHLTLGFAVQVTVLAGHRLVIYPSPDVQALNEKGTLGLSAAALPQEMQVRTIAPDMGDTDDVFKKAEQLQLARPDFLQRVDVLILDGPGMAVGAPMSLRLQVRSVVRAGSAETVKSWLVLTARREDWSRSDYDVSNSNQFEWRGGAIRIVPAFEPSASMLRTSSRQASSEATVSVQLVPTAPVPRNWFLRVSAPSMFLWKARCVSATSPTAMVETDVDCWRDGNFPNIVLLKLTASMQPGLIYHFDMHIILPTAVAPPNLWEVMVLHLPHSPENATLARESHVLDQPHQAIRLPGFELMMLDAVLELQQSSASDVAEFGYPVLLLYRVTLQGDAEDALNMAALPIVMKVTAPMPVVVHCPLPRDPEGAMPSPGHDGASVLYPHGVSYNAGAQEGSIEEWSEHQLLALDPIRPTLHRCRAELVDGVSSVELELRTPIIVRRTAAIPLRASVGLPEGETASQQASADDYGKVFTPWRMWRVQLLGGLGGDALATTETVRTRPATLSQATSDSDAGDGSPVDACPAQELCLEVNSTSFSDPTVVPSATAAQQDMGQGFDVLFRLALPFVPEAVPDAFPAVRLKEGFAHRADGSDFPAQAAVRSYLQLTAPSPLLWSAGCTVSGQILEPAGLKAKWNVVCFDGDAFVFVSSYAGGDGGGGGAAAAGAAMRADLVLSAASLAGAAPAGLPLSGFWSVSLFAQGRLRAQRIVQVEQPSSGLLRLALGPLNETETSRRLSADAADGTLGADRSSECADKALEDFPCPEGMYAYGVRAVRFGGLDSWLDNVQLLCKEELDIGTNHTQWAVRPAVTGVAGDTRFGSRSAEGTAGALEDVLECHNGSAGLLVGGKAELWRKRRILGLSLACEPWAAVERGVAWDESVGEVLRPEGVEGEEEEELAGVNCSGSEPIPGSETWAACTGLEHAANCELEQEKCCCQAGYSYGTAQKECEPCVGGNWTLSGAWKMCPLGEAIVGFRAATLDGPVCAVEFVCGTVSVRHYAGKIIPDGVVYAEDKEEELVEGAGAGVTAFTDQEIEWWHYIVMVVSSAVVLRVLWVICCRRRMQYTVYGDVEGDGIPSHHKVGAAMKRPFIFLHRRILRPLWDSFKHRVWAPIYLHVVLPALDYIKETKAFKRCVVFYGRCKRAFTCFMQTFCPCILWCFHKRHMAKKVIESLSPKSLQRQWQAGDGSPRRMALELRRRIESGELSPRSLKADLTKRYARGDLTPRSFHRRMAELQKALSDSPRASKIVEQGGAGARLLRFVGWKPKEEEEEPPSLEQEEDDEEGEEGAADPSGRKSIKSGGSGAASPRGSARSRRSSRHSTRHSSRRGSRSSGEGKASSSSGSSSSSEGEESDEEEDEESEEEEEGEEEEDGGPDKEVEPSEEESETSEEESD